MDRKYEDDGPDGPDGHSSASDEDVNPVEVNMNTPDPAERARLRKLTVSPMF